LQESILAKEAGYYGSGISIQDKKNNGCETIEERGGGSGIGNWTLCGVEVMIEAKNSRGAILNTS